MDIWTEWKDHYRTMGLDGANICEDGIINKQKYDATHPRILFVLRETNEFTGGLAQLLADGPHYPMWYAVARWAAGILKAFPPFEEVDKDAILQDAIQRIAVINLKKVTGGAAADLITINAYAYRDRVLLSKQIRSIAPEIIVACGTFDALIWLLDVAIEPGEPHVKAVLDKTTGARVVPFVHPARVDKRVTYQRLTSLLSPETAGRGL